MTSRDVALPDGGHLEVTVEGGRIKAALDGEEITKDQALALLDAVREQSRSGWQNRHARPVRPGIAVAAPGDLVSPTGIMVIAEVDGGIRLFASRDIPRATFGIEQVDFKPEWKVGSVMRAMLIITRPTLGECLAELGRIWGNHDRGAAERKAVDQHLGITSG